MKISSIAYSVPPKSYTNEEFVEMCMAKMTNLKDSEKDNFSKVLLKMLTYSGASKRHIRDYENGETAYEHILSAMKQSLEKAHTDKDDIDLLIYCGVGKGFIEPSNAYLYAKEMGMKDVQCFDVVDACMSWTRAMQICQGFLKSKTFKKIMVVTGEFHYGIRDTYDFTSIKDLSYSFPMFTIGEAATATILEDSDNDWEFNFLSKPEHADLCTIPIKGHETFLPPYDKIGLNGPGKFVSFGVDLLNVASPILTGLIERSFKDYENIDLFIPHAPAKTVYIKNLAEIGIDEEKIYTKIFESFGNLVSSSVPIGIAYALKEERIVKGSQISLIPASAGLSAATVKLKL